MEIIAENQAARHDYEIIQTFESGIVLVGHEVKSVKTRGMTLRGAYVRVTPSAAWLLGGHISPYPPAGPLPAYDPGRSRKLLLNKRELTTLTGRVRQGLTIVPLKVYTRLGKIKVEIALARGKKKYEKRAQIKKREAERTIRAALKHKT